MSRRRQYSHWLLVAAALLLVIVGTANATEITPTEQVKSPPTPVFATNYRVEGLLSLPYAELNEPFSAWYDKETSRSRTDYYGDLYKIYQFGPKSAPEQDDREYGSMYKLAWVPSDLKLHNQANREPKSSQKPSSLYERVQKVLESAHFHHPSSSAHVADDAASKESHDQRARRACFAVKGGVGYTIQAQTVLPNLNDFSYDSTGRCPHVNHEHKHSKCELWKLTTNVGDKKNTYKMWVKRNEQTGLVIPVHYYMLGYDSLLGSHYDRYDVTYFNFVPSAALDADFAFDAQSQQCESMPGPGDNSTNGERRSHMIVANPIHEFVQEPHVYDHVDHEFGQFTDKHSKSYETESHQRKGWRNFLHNFRFINGKNRELKQYKLAVNHFADNDMKELSYLRGRLHSNGYNGGLDYATHNNLKKSSGRLELESLPASWDWTIRGAVTPVKDQAVCGSCWSFGTTGALEGAAFVKTGKLPNLSQQQLVDCSWKFGNNGCDGGEDFRAYKYVMEAGGIATEEDYGGYLGVDGKCHDDKVKKAVKITGFYNVTAGDQEALKHALVKYGPVAVSIDASRPTFTFYSHGVYYDEKCGNKSDNLDHLVLVVGYAELDGKFVWQVKNSWSTYWGNNGYIMMSSENNNCGVMDAPTVPIVRA